MKGRSVLLDEIGGRRVAALLVDGQLDDLLIDPDEAQGPTPGTVFRARVDRPVKGLGGMFMILPDGARGFLRGAKGLAPGQSLLVQVTGHAEPGKAVPLTARVLFKSKYVIVTPGAPGRNVSRQVRDEARREALEALAAEHGPGDAGTGMILRSEAAEADDAAIAEDIGETVALAAAILADAAGPVERLLDGPDAHALAWREWGTPDEVDTAPGCLAARGTLEQIGALAAPEVALPGGGSLWVEPTRALVACDVNTGGDGSPAAALKANLAAVRALPRALRLRGLGGQVVVDFAPLAKKDRRQMEQALKSAFRADPVETTLVGWTPLGHFEAQRKRERAPLDARLLGSL